jgi:hypothetical protein
MSPEEFFMYLIIALVVVIPISVRVYRYLTIKRVQQMVRREFQRQPSHKSADTSDSKER